MKNCLLCGELTHGSIGAAGLVWDNCCQTCKDSEDAALSLQIKAAAKGLRFVLGSLGLGEQGSGIRAGQGEVDTLRKQEKMEQFASPTLTSENKEETSHLPGNPAEYGD